MYQMQAHSRATLLVSLLLLINSRMLSMWLPNFIPPVHDHYGDLSETSFSLCSTQYLSNVPIRPIDCVKMHTASEFKGVIPAAGMGGIGPP